MALDYKSSGVNIDEGNALVTDIKNIVQKSENIGLFGCLQEINLLGYKNPVLVSGTDGVGTKLKLAFESNRHDTIGVDLVAMSVNDIICHGAKPLFFLDYYSTSKLDRAVARDVITGINKGCELAGCTLSGGETSEMPGIYEDGHYDLAGFAVGIVEKDDILPKKDKIKKGDAIYAIPSSGVHSNGFSLVNAIIKDKNIDIYKEELNGRKLIDILLEPTRIYIKDLLPIVKNVKAFANITGGGIYENTMRVVPEGCDLQIDYDAIKRLDIFNYLQETGNIAEEEMRRVFNLGVGMVFVPSEGELDTIKKHIPEAYKIGEII